MSPVYKKINPIFVLIALFFVFKLSHIHVPYFWDELGVYSEGSLYLFDHGVSLLPNAMPPNLSRGHPLMCSAFFAVGYKILGPHVWAGHLWALMVSCGLLYLLYKFTSSLFDRKTGCFAALLLAVQPVFIAQSVMVLPEVLLAFLCTASLYAFLRGRFVWLALLSSIAILTKETAVVLPCCLGAIIVLRYFTEGNIKRRFSELLLVSTPLWVWGIFLLIQKAQNGWFFFPLHADYVSFSFSNVFSRLGYYLSFLFKGQGRFVWFMVMATAGGLYLFEQRKRLFTKSYISECLISNERMPERTLILYCIVTLLVSILNFHLARYLLLVFPVFCMLIAAQAVYIMRHMRLPLRMVLFFSLIFLPLVFYRGSVFNVDVDMGYLELVKAQKEITDRLDELAEENSIIATHFPVSKGLTNSRAGYSIREYTIVRPDTEEVHADYFIFASPGDFDFRKKDMEPFILLHQVKSPLVEMYLLKKKSE